ncbi:glycosyltransferase family 4 protein [Algoriphagus aquimarinus]|uniref:glycosyltransferase family 4 protein n=1 Tax=Algoriphagus aquimarinus TaxID=237018 RepID=UPI0030DCF9D3|tara:strand:- start:321 stop:1463 length:1143 start_codon:yes stop_codon:yes gene_type:complete
MHICFLSHEYPKAGLNPGGVGVFLYTFCHALIEAGHRVTVLGANDSNKTEDEIQGDLRIIRFAKPAIPGVNWWLIARKLNAYLRDINTSHPLDIVESSELGLAFLQKLPNVKYVIRLHGGHHFFAESELRGINRWKGFQEKRSFKKADAFIAVSDYVREHTANYLSYHGKPLETIRYMIDQKRFAYKESYPEAKDFSLVFAGTICEKKGVGNLVDAIAKVSLKFPQVTLDIYGKEWFFPNGDSYTDYIHSKIPSNLKNQIRIHAPVAHDEIPQVYGKAAICIFPSFMETQGLVAPEAMAMGKVVIFTDKGPGPETITHGLDGFLCNPLDVSSIESAIITAFEAKDQFHEIGKKANEKVNSVFNVSNALTNITFYKSLING